jgi:hypothetical protein
VGAVATRANDLSAVVRAFPLRLVKACTKRFRGNAMDTAAEANAIQADARSDENLAGNEHRVAQRIAIRRQNGA